MLPIISSEDPLYSTGDIIRKGSSRRTLFQRRDDLFWFSDDEVQEDKNE